GAEGDLRGLRGAQQDSRGSPRPSTGASGRGKDGASAERQTAGQEWATPRGMRWWILRIRSREYGRCNRTGRADPGRSLGRGGGGPPGRTVLEITSFLAN